jgi:hypothetical protein
MSLLLRNGPRDFYKFAKITGDLIAENNVDDHHVFPRGYLEGKVPSRQRDSILNRTLIDRRTNIRISNHAPSAYMKQIRESYEADPELGVGKFEELLESHLLPVGLDSPFWSDNFEAFLDWRQETLWQEIQKVTGITASADHFVADYVHDDEQDWLHDEEDAVALSPQVF